MPDEHQALESALRRSLQRRPPPNDLAAAVAARLRPAPHRHAAWRAAAAAVTLAILIGFGLWRQQRDRTRQAQVAAGQIQQALQLAAADLGRVQRRLQATP